VTRRISGGHHGTSPDGVERELVDDGVGVGGDLPVQLDDAGTRLVRGGPHVGVGFGGPAHPRQHRAEGPAERGTEVAPLDGGAVLHQSEQVRAGRHERPAGVVLGDPVDLPQERGPRERR
jgi:hypothetical protein